VKDKAWQTANLRASCLGVNIDNVRCLLVTSAFSERFSRRYAIYPYGARVGRFDTDTDWLCVYACCLNETFLSDYSNDCAVACFPTFDHDHTWQAASASVTSWQRTSGSADEGDTTASLVDPDAIAAHTAVCYSHGNTNPAPDYQFTNSEGTAHTGSAQPAAHPCD
jgi:hypothetical protein